MTNGFLLLIIIIMKEHDLLSIKEFAALTGIKQSTLRHYDEVKLFQPVRRNENGYRYYSATQALAINLIHVMNSVGVPLKTISEIQEDRTPERMLELLRGQESILNQELLRLQRAYAIMHTYSRIISEGLLADEQALHTQTMLAEAIELGPLNDFSSGHFFNSFFKHIQQMSARRVDSAYPVGGYYPDMGAFLRTPGRPPRFFSLVPDGQDTKDAGEYLVGYARGYYSNLGDLPQRLQDHADSHSLAFVGPVYILYLHDEVSVADPNQYLIQASVPVKKRKA